MLMILKFSIFAKNIGLIYDPPFRLSVTWVESERFVHKILCTVILKIVNYPLESERETVSEQFQGSWRLGTAQALHAQYKDVSSVDTRHLGTPYERIPRFLSTREFMVGNLRDSEAARYFLVKVNNLSRSCTNFDKCMHFSISTGIAHEYICNRALVSCKSFGRITHHKAKTGTCKYSHL